MPRQIVLLSSVLMISACGSGNEGAARAYWAMAGCPSVETGVYTKNIQFVSAACLANGTIWKESVFIDDKGLLEGTPGCAFTHEKKTPAACSADLEMTCPVRQYIGIAKIVGINALEFNGTMTIGDGCHADVRIDFGSQ
jgi:hypothetical protein